MTIGPSNREWALAAGLLDLTGAPSKFDSGFEESSLEFSLWANSTGGLR